MDGAGEDSQASTGASSGGRGARGGRRGRRARAPASTGTGSGEDRRFSSPFFGVSWHKSSERWAVQIRHEGKRIHVGYYVDEVAAAKAYDEVARRLRGPKTKTNFNTKGQRLRPANKAVFGEDERERLGMRGKPRAIKSSRRRRRVNNPLALEATRDLPVEDEVAAGRVTSAAEALAPLFEESVPTRRSARSATRRRRRTVGEESDEEFQPSAKRRKGGGGGGRGGRRQWESGLVEDEEEEWSGRRSGRSGRSGRGTGSRGRGKGWDSGMDMEELDRRLEREHEEGEWASMGHKRTPHSKKRGAPEESPPSGKTDGSAKSASPDTQNGAALMMALGGHTSTQIPASPDRPGSVRVGEGVLGNASSSSHQHIPPGIASAGLVDHAGVSGGWGMGHDGHWGGGVGGGSRRGTVPSSPASSGVFLDSHHSHLLHSPPRGGPRSPVRVTHSPIRASAGPLMMHVQSPPRGGRQSADLERGGAASGGGGIAGGRRAGLMLSLSTGSDGHAPAPSTSSMTFGGGFGVLAADPITDLTDAAPPRRVISASTTSSTTSESQSKRATTTTTTGSTTASSAAAKAAEEALQSATGFRADRSPLGTGKKSDEKPNTSPGTAMASGVLASLSITPKEQ